MTGRAPAGEVATNNPRGPAGDVRDPTNEALLRVAAALAAELDLDRLVQIITDEATALCRASFGAFFYNMLDDRGESYVLYSLSGVPREAFARFPMPRNTEVFAPTFRGDGVVRSDDITRDPRYGKNASHRGMPEGHLPVRSYLAVPVVSRSKEVLGGLFFGHPEVGMFTADDEYAVMALAVHAAIAIDNARLYRAARNAEALQERRAKEAALSADVGVAVTMPSSIPAMLQRCAEAMVAHLDGALARIWTLEPREEVLVLKASAGAHTHVDGAHARIPLGALKIGLIARRREPICTNDLARDPAVSDPAWIRREGMVGFAGYPLLVDGRVVGVVALFTRRPLADDARRALASAADVIAIGIERRRVEEERAALMAAEQEARAEAERARRSLSTTLKSIGDAVIATDTEGVITFMNPVAEALTGWTEGEAQGRPLREVFRIVNEVTRRPAESPVDKVIERGAVVGLANHAVLIRRDGAELAIDDSGAPIRDAGGALRGVVLVFRDVTDKKREANKRDLLAETSDVLASSLDFEKTLESVARLVVPRVADWCAIDLAADPSGAFAPAPGDSVWPSHGSPLRVKRVALAHADGRKVSLAEELDARYPPDPSGPNGLLHVLRTGASELYPEITDEQMEAAAIDAEHLRILRELELRSVMIVPLVARGRVLGAVSLAYAESERRYTPRDLEFAGELARRAGVAVDNAMLYASEQAARDAADQANRAKDDFLATVSHELRTPLNAMLGWTRMLRTGTLPEARKERALETIERNAVTQAQLIEDLLDISRIVSGKMRLEVQTVELAHIVELAIDSLRLASEAKEIRVVASLDGHAGALMGDPDRLQQVVWNLLNNAIKFTAKGGRIQVAVERVDSSVRLSVTDTGRGIAPDFLPFVFERFKQADNSISRVHGGLGLGLAISRHIVELHGGTIEAQSLGEGLGARFVVKLPVAAVRPEARATSARLATVPSMMGFERLEELAGLRILVVDDEQDARDLLTEVLESCGSIVTRADSATKALVVIERELPDVLISDIGMPGEDGYAFIRKVRELPPERGGRIPAAALTAYARAEDRRRALNAGYMMHIPKPVEPAELVAVIANLARFSLGRS